MLEQAIADKKAQVRVVAYDLSEPDVVSRLTKIGKRLKVIFVYGISDKKVGGITLQKPNGNLAPVNPAALKKNVAEPFKAEPGGPSTTRTLEKFAIASFSRRLLLRRRLWIEGGHRGLALIGQGPFRRAPMNP